MIEIAFGLRVLFCLINLSIKIPWVELKDQVNFLFPIAYAVILKLLLICYLQEKIWVEIKTLLEMS